MPNSKVLTGVSLVGATLAAVLALFWFWGKKSPNENNSKDKKSNASVQSQRKEPILSLRSENGTRETTVKTVNYKQEEKNVRKYVLQNESVPVEESEHVSRAFAICSGTTPPAGTTSGKIGKDLAENVDCSIAQCSSVKCNEVTSSSISHVARQDQSNAKNDSKVTQSDINSGQTHISTGLLSGKAGQETIEAVTSDPVNQCISVSRPSDISWEISEVITRHSPQNKEITDAGETVAERVNQCISVSRPGDISGESSEVITRHSPQNEEITDAGETVAERVNQCISVSRPSDVSEESSEGKAQYSPQSQEMTDAGVTRNRNICLHDVTRDQSGGKDSQTASVDNLPNISTSDSDITESEQTVVDECLTLGEPLTLADNKHEQVVPTSIVVDNIIPMQSKSASQGLLPEEVEQLETESKIYETVLQDCVENRLSTEERSKPVIDYHILMSSESVQPSDSETAEKNDSICNNNEKDLLVPSSTCDSEIKTTPVNENTESSILNDGKRKAEESVESGDNSSVNITAGLEDISDISLDSYADVETVTGAQLSESCTDPTSSKSEERGRSTESGLSRDSLEPEDNTTGQPYSEGDVVEQDENTEPSSEKPDLSIPQAGNGDNTSEASNDSGKGASVGETPTRVTPEVSIYQLDFPTALCGRLIGRQGKNINAIKNRTGTKVFLRANPYTTEYQICSIEGYPNDIEEALAMIRDRFPKSTYPDLQLEPTNLGQETPVVLPDLQMTLPPSVSIDVVVSSIATGGLIFLQQPTHPTFPSLERLNQFMLACYSQDLSTPLLPRPVEAGVICAAPVMEGWYRAMVVEVTDDGEECYVKFVDYGGYCQLPASNLRQIRSDFMTLPFQAVECYMGNLTPLQGETTFSAECASVLEELTEGKLLQAQVVDRASDGIPFVHIYQVSGDKALFVNREMVNRGVAQWIEQFS